MILGVDGVEDGHSRPMTACVEEQHAPIWFFTGDPRKDYKDKVADVDLDD